MDALAALPDAVVIDVRTAEEYASGHVDGAMHVPLDELASRAATLPKHVVLVTACGKGGGRSDAAGVLAKEPPGR